MSDRGTYIRAVEAHFLKYRGSGFVLSPKDEAVVERWYDKQIPLQNILRELDAAVGHAREQDNRYQSRPRSIAFFARQVEAKTERISSSPTQAAAKSEFNSGPNVLQFRSDCATALSDLKQRLSETGSAIQTLDGVLEQLGNASDEELWAIVPELDATIDRLLIASIPSEKRVKYQEDAEARIRDECGPYLSPAARKEQELEALSGSCRDYYEFKGLISIAAEEL